MVATAATIVILMTSVVSSTCSAERNLGSPTVSYQSLKVYPERPKGCLFHIQCEEHGQRSRQHCPLISYRLRHDLQVHVQARGDGELSRPEGPDVPEVARQT